MFFFQLLLEKKGNCLSYSIHSVGKILKIMTIQFTDTIMKIIKYAKYMNGAQCNNKTSNTAFCKYYVQVITTERHHSHTKTKSSRNNNNKQSVKN